MASGPSHSRFQTEENLLEVIESHTGRFCMPDTPSSTGSDDTTAQPPSQTAETGLNDGTIDQEQEQPEQPQEQIKAPVTKRRKLEGVTHTKIVHHMKLRERKPKAALAKLHVEIPKPSPRKRQRKKSASEVAKKKTKTGKQPPSPTFPERVIKKEDPDAPEVALDAIPPKPDTMIVPTIRHEDEVKLMKEITKRKAQSPIVTVQPRKYQKILPKPTEVITVIQPPQIPPISAHATTVTRPMQIPPEPTHATTVPKPPQVVNEDSISPTNKSQNPIPGNASILAKRPSPIQPPPEIQPTRVIISKQAGGTAFVPPQWMGVRFNWNTEYTWAYISSLLPGSQHGAASYVEKARLWTLRDEAKLRDLWKPEDELEILDSTPSEEVQVAAAVQRIYACRLEDLFRYGLRRPIGKASTSSFWAALLQLLPHPYFAGDIAHLRYALQQAVICRFGGESNHTRALLPPWSGQEPGFVTYLKECRERYPRDSSGWRSKTQDLVDAAEFQCRMQVLGHFMAGYLNGAGQRRHDLNTIMYARLSEEHQPPRVAGDWERWLFVLREEDVVFLASCLDELGERDHLVQNQYEDDKWKVARAPAQTLTGEEMIDVELEAREERITDGGWERGDQPTKSVRENVLAKGYQGSRPRKQRAQVEKVTVKGAYEAYYSKLTLEEKILGLDARMSYFREKREAIISSRREHLIRLRIDPSLRWNRPTKPDDKDRDMLELLDIPPFDPNPLFERFPEGSFVDEYNLNVVRGIRPAPDVINWLLANRGYFPSLAKGGERRVDPADQGLDVMSFNKVYGGQEPRRPEVQGGCQVAEQPTVLLEMENKIDGGTKGTVERTAGGGFTEKVVELPEKGRAIPTPIVLVQGVPIGKRKYKTI